jgi:hypothetical protein
VAQLARQLARSGEELVRELTAYERKYGEPFVYKSEHFLEVLAGDMQSLTTDTPPVRRIAARWSGV